PRDGLAGLCWRVRTSRDGARAMAERLARGAQGQCDRLDAELAKVSENWRFDRIAGIDKTILRLATFELMQERQTPSSVVIDEAVELAKRFSEKGSPPFVNGVL